MSSSLPNLDSSRLLKCTDGLVWYGLASKVIFYVCNYLWKMSSKRVEVYISNKETIFEKVYFLSSPGPDPDIFKILLLRI